MSKAEELAKWLDNLVGVEHPTLDKDCAAHLRALDASHQRLKEALIDVTYMLSACRFVVTDSIARKDMTEGYNRAVAAIEQAKALS